MAPISEYFKGRGSEVMKGMRKQYGERAEDVFYATANKKDMKPRKKATKKSGAYYDVFSDSMKSGMRNEPRPKQQRRIEKESSKGDILSQSRPTDGMSYSKTLRKGI